MAKIPVFVVHGFLESGKTSFLRYTLGQEYFEIDGNTLLILCEEGEEEYGEELLKRTNTTLLTVDDPEEMTLEWLQEADRKYRPERVIIEATEEFLSFSKAADGSGWLSVFQSS